MCPLFVHPILFVRINDVNTTTNSKSNNKGGDGNTKRLLKLVALVMSQVTLPWTLAGQD
jgi:hypothetical protein